MLSWAGTAAIMSILIYKRNLFPLIPFSILGLVMSILFFYQSSPLWTIGIGVCTGAIVPYILQPSQEIGSWDKSSGYGIASGLMVIMLLVYLKPYIPNGYLETLISALPLSWLLFVPLLSPISQEKSEGKDTSYWWGYSLIMLFTVSLITGVYQDIIFRELSLIEWPHYLIVFTSSSSGAFVIGHYIGKRGLRLPYSLSFMFSIPLSLALFGFKASTLTYMLSDMFIGFGLGAAAMFFISLIHSYKNSQRALCIMAIGLGYYGHQFCRPQSKGVRC